MFICMYKRLMVVKSCLNRIHWIISIVRDIFIKLRKENSWEEANNLDNREFFKLGKYIWKGMFPHNAELFKAEEEEEE